MEARFFGPIWQRWRTGILATVLLHGGALLALSVTFYSSHRIAAPPSFAVEMVMAPPAAQPQLNRPTEPQPTHQSRPDLPLPLIAPPPPAQNGLVLPPPVPGGRDPVSTLSAPTPGSAPPAAPVAIAPTPRTATSSFDPHAQLSWESDVLARLEAAKRYPPSARFAHEEATVQVQFEVDRGGHVVRSKLLRASGVPDLDAEALALLRRVRLPAPPAAIPAESLTLAVPIEFAINPN